MQLSGFCGTQSGPEKGSWEILLINAIKLGNQKQPCTKKHRITDKTYFYCLKEKCPFILNKRLHWHFSLQLNDCNKNRFWYFSTFYLQMCYYFRQSIIKLSLLSNLIQYVSNFICAHNTLMGSTEIPLEIFLFRENPFSFFLSL